MSNDARVLLLSVLCWIATTMLTACTSAPDPFIIVETAGEPDYQTTFNKTLRSPTINTAIKNLVLICAGQSNMADIAPTNYTPTNGTKVDNFNIRDGGNYAGVDPMLGTTQSMTTAGLGNFAGRLADKLINAGKFDRIILVPIAVGGTSVSYWETTIAANRFTVTFKRLQTAGITIGLTNTTFAIIWGQGETDQANGTTQSAYAASLANVIAAARNAGFTQGSVPFFVAEQTWNGGAVSTAVQNAQIAAVNHANNIWAGPNADSLNATNRQADNTHWNDTGSDAYAGLWQTALGGFGPPF